MIQLIPAIDLIEGQCVRLTKGDYGTRKIYNTDPLDVAKQMQDYGFTRLHIVDLDGARSSRIVNHQVLERIATHTDLTIDFGGGLKTDEDLRIANDSGASLFTIGSIAVTQPAQFLDWLARYGTARIILGADVKEGRIAIHGWQEESSDELLPFLDRYIRQGVSQVLCTDVSRDGMLQGPATSLYQEVMDAHPTLHLIASGGVSSMDDLRQLNEAGIPAVVFGKAIYEGRIRLEELSEWL